MCEFEIFLCVFTHEETPPLGGLLHFRETKLQLTYLVAK